MKWNAVIFDLDGTLLNTLGDLADACNAALGELGFPAHAEDSYRYFVGDGANKLCERVLPEARRTTEEITRLRVLFDEAYRVNMFHRTAPYPGIPELLAGLRRAGVRLGVLSNKPDSFVQSIVARYFPDALDAVAGQRGACVKPDPSGVNALMNRFGISPSEALYVGDSAVDMQTAHNASVHSCGAAWGFRGEGELLAADAEWIARTPSDILQVLKEES